MRRGVEQPDPDEDDVVPVRDDATLSLFPPADSPTDLPLLAGVRAFLKNYELAEEADHPVTLALKKFEFNLRDTYNDALTLYHDKRNLPWDRNPAHKEIRQRLLDMNTNARHVIRALEALPVDKFLRAELKTVVADAKTELTELLSALGVEKAGFGHTKLIAPDADAITRLYERHAGHVVTAAPAASRVPAPVASAPEPEPIAAPVAAEPAPQPLVYDCAPLEPGFHARSSRLATGPTESIVPKTH